MRLVPSAAVAAVLVSALLGAPGVPREAEGFVGMGVAQPARAATLDSSEADLVAQVNAFRSGRGLATLTVSDTLTAAAKWMSTDMAVRDYFSHS